ncbi:MAG: hypothetical protein ACXW3R_03965, partial [Rhodoplanes sp.]
RIHRQGCALPTNPQATTNDVPDSEKAIGRSTAAFASDLVSSNIHAKFYSPAVMQNLYAMQWLVSHPAPKSPTRFHEDPGNYLLPFVIPEAERSSAVRNP